MRMFRWVQIFIIGFLFSCSDSKGPKGTVINGTVNYPGSASIYLELLTPDGFELVDSTQADAHGSFLLHTHITDDQIYRINFFNRQKNMLVLGGSSIQIVADGNSMEGMFRARGNPGVEDLTLFSELSKSHQLRQGLLKYQVNSASQQGKQLELDSLIQVQQQGEAAYLAKATEFVRRQAGTLTGLFMLCEYFDIEPNLKLYNELIPEFQNELTEHWYYIQSVKNYEKISRLAISATPPDFTLPDPNGNPISLNSFRGKYIYLDFWASWCQPCRRDNPYLVKVYDKYDRSNFEIIGVSFDKRKDRWLDAIEKDQLTWIHVSDLKYFDSEMIELYNITNVPMTFLLDPEGRIIAKNLHYSELDQMLSDLL